MKHSNILILVLIGITATLCVYCWLARRGNSSGKPLVILPRTLLESSTSSEIRVGRPSLSVEMAGLTQKTTQAKQTAIQHNPRGEKDSIVQEFTEEEKKLLEQGLSGGMSGGMDARKKVAEICLKYRFTREQLTHFLGRSTYPEKNRKSTYSVAPSQWVDFYFDEDGRVVKVEVSGLPVVVDSNTQNLSTGH